MTRGTGHEDQAGYRRRLENERRRLLAAIRRLEEQGLDESLSESFQEFSTYDNHPADVGTETFERSKDFGLREDRLTTLNLVEDALERLDEGTYGVCRRCGQPIGEGRLEVVPWTAYCRPCEARLEHEERRDWERPPEEGAVRPFSSFNDQDDREPVGFDGEDAWQAVARYGTSNSPADVSRAPGYDQAYIGSEEDRGVVASDIDSVPDSTFDPGQAGREGTLEYEDGWIMSSREGRAESAAGPDDTEEEWSGEVPFTGGAGEDVDEVGCPPADEPGRRDPDAKRKRRR